MKKKLPNLFIIRFNKYLKYLLVILIVGFFPFDEYLKRNCNFFDKEKNIYIYIITTGILLCYYIYTIDKKLKRQIDEYKKDNSRLIETLDSIAYKLNPPEALNRNVEFGSQEIYIDYKILEVSEFSRFLSSYYNLYKLCYQINFDKLEKWDNIEFKFKTRSEDVLQFSSINTGNSITFKTKTGWLPSIGTKDGDIILGLPKGALTLCFIGYLMQNMISFGISSYKDLIDIQHTKLENTKLESELQELKNKAKSQNPEVQEKIQSELYTIYNLTINNHNIKHIKVTQNTSNETQNNR